MRCEKCQGSGYLAVMGQASAPSTLLCPACNGQCVAYCCDEAGANPPNAWPLKGSDELYDAIEIHGKDIGC